MREHSVFSSHETHYVCCSDPEVIGALIEKASEVVGTVYEVSRERHLSVITVRGEEGSSNVLELFLHLFFKNDKLEIIIFFLFSYSIFYPVRAGPLLFSQ